MALIIVGRSDLDESHVGRLITAILYEDWSIKEKIREHKEGAKRTVLLIHCSEEIDLPVSELPTDILKLFRIPITVGDKFGDGGYLYVYITTEHRYGIEMPKLKKLYACGFIVAQTAIWEWLEANLDAPWKPTADFFPTQS